MNKKQILEIKENSLTLDGKPFYLASGDMHYFRFFREGWKRRLQLMKDFGLTAIQTYVPWNMHEAEEGKFNFEGNLNIADFLQTCEDVGLKVMFRPSPYMCSEWDWGGLPYWLLKKILLFVQVMKNLWDIFVDITNSLYHTFCHIFLRMADQLLRLL